MYLIIGASSFIGKHLYQYCKINRIEVLGTYYKHLSNREWVYFDLRTGDLRMLCQKYLDKKNPDAVIICGANTDIDSCKKDIDSSYELNVSGAERIFMQADQMGIKSVFMSSEAVFDGKKGLYSEDDIPNPVTVYGNQKLQVERYMIQNLRRYLIFRISRAAGSCYGEKDIFDEFYNKIVNKREIVCLKNQSFCITEVNDISKCLIETLKKDMNGLYHISSSNYTTRFELAYLYAKKVFGGYEKIIEKSYEDIPFLDNRHIFGGLNGTKLESLLGIRYTGLQKMLDNYFETYICMKMESEPNKEAEI